VVVETAHGQPEGAGKVRLFELATVSDAISASKPRDLKDEAYSEERADHLAFLKELHSDPMARLNVSAEA
jgi:hypothetical protein